jgi:hypothetical protein
MSRSGAYLVLTVLLLLLLPLEGPEPSGYRPTIIQIEMNILRLSILNKLPNTMPTEDDYENTQIIAIIIV